MASNWRAARHARDYLVANDIVAIADIDTRALTRVLRSAGVMRGVIATGPGRSAGAGREGARHPADGRRRPGEGRHLRGAVRLRADRSADAGDAGHAFGVAPERRAVAARCGSPPTTSASSATSCAGWPRTAATCTVFPATAPAADLLALRARRHLPQQRPRRSGRASATPSTTCRQLVDAGRADVRHLPRPPDAGARRSAATTFKLKFGHRGANHPVKDLASGKVEITSQNHGFAVDPDVAARRRRGDAPQSLRRHGRRASATLDKPDLLGAVPPRGVARARTTPTICSGSSSTRWNAS